MFYSYCANTDIYFVVRAKTWPLLTNNKDNHAKKFSYQASQLSQVGKASMVTIN